MSVSSVQPQKIEDPKTPKNNVPNQKVLPVDIRISSTGIRNMAVFLAHENGNWGPERPSSDYKKHRFSLIDDGKTLVCGTECLTRGEEFKIVVCGLKTNKEARLAYDARFDAGVLSSSAQFDWDADQKTLWLLVPDFSVTRLGHWNQSNVYGNPA